MKFAVWFIHRVAPHTGAWIETIDDMSIYGLTLVAPHTGAWIETDAQAELMARDAGRPPHGGVD